MAVSARSWSSLRKAKADEYERLPLYEEEKSLPNHQGGRGRSLKLRAFYLLVIFLAGYYIFSVTVPAADDTKPCDSIGHGYTCSPRISRFWGQYSLYFEVPSDVPVDLPADCTVTFAQILSRHGGRDPTSSKTVAYNDTIEKIHENVKSYAEEFRFLEDYEYKLGADQLTTAGLQQMVNSGIKYFKRYKGLAEKIPPFVRASGQKRVVDSAEGWLDGFYHANGTEQGKHVDVIISEDEGMNNTLSHSLCTAFEKSTFGGEAQATWGAVFLPPIQARLNENLVGANLTTTEALYMMDLCPFETVAHPTGQVSPFCGLFKEEEWHQYDYYQSLGKYYGYGNGNPLGSTQGVGFVNELIARMTDSPVNDHTCANSTLDSNEDTFPLGRQLYADFSHDNDMSGVLAALGLYNDTEPLSTTTLETIDQTKGFSAAWTVPFAARVYVEKIQCAKRPDELVRVVVNDRVLPLAHCGGDKYGRCTLEAFVESLSFARNGGQWGQCFV